MNHVGTKEIETKRLILRKARLDDASYMFSNWSNDEEAVKFLSWNAHKSQCDSEKLIENLLSQYTNDDVYTWVITTKNDNLPIGYINIHAIHNHHKRGEVSYCIGRRFWNNGYATEALKAIVRFAIAEVGFKKLIGLCDIRNFASEQVLVKAGFELEGILKQHEMDKYSRMQDLKCYAIYKRHI